MAGEKRVTVYCADAENNVYCELLYVSVGNVTNVVSNMFLFVVVVAINYVWNMVVNRKSRFFY